MDAQSTQGSDFDWTDVGSAIGGIASIFTAKDKYAADKDIAKAQVQTAAASNQNTIILVMGGLAFFALILFMLSKR